MHFQVRKKEARCLLAWRIVILAVSWPDVYQISPTPLAQIPSREISHRLRSALGDLLALLGPYVRQMLHVRQSRDAQSGLD